VPGTIETHGNETARVGGFDDVPKEPVIIERISAEG